MAIIKCKMCGGDIELAADKTFGTCEFCGSTMTLPKIDDDQRAAAFNRGNHFRRIGEFDKALAVYERIVREDDTDAEAHWCCALCRFGIEYVEDPTTYEYLPTCHRASFDSFLEDVDYLAAVEHSEGITKRQYQKDAAKIAEVQRGILVTSQNEEPFDVFICYKESDENGERTRDSLMAQDVYYQLTDQGYRVFFARITLEDVVGKQYEPYIFAALNSAKVMIAIGTRPEYMNAVWVKNEWSRFLAMMKKDRHKLLLPCYKDMDPYDMPEQLAVLQSYDMSKIGFIQDLIRGIKKVLDADKKPEQAKETVVVQQTAATPTAPLLQRAFMFLEDGEWNSANEYCEKVLDIDPENAQAYLGKLLSELRVRKQEALKNCAKPFDHNNNYQKALRFGDEKLKAELKGYIDHINTRNENARLDGIYTRAKNAMAAAKTEHGYKEAAQLFESIREYQDAAALAQSCYEKAEVARKDAILAGGKAKMTGKVISNYEAAIKLFASIPGWKDADDQIAACQKKIEEKRKAEEEKKKCDELYKEYKAAVQNEKTGAVKKAEANKKIASLKNAYNNLNNLKNSWQGIEDEQFSLNERLEQIKSEISSLTAERSNLGFFAGKRKKEITERIATLENDQKSLIGDIASLQKKKLGHNTLSEVESNVNIIIQQLEEQNKIIDELSSARSSQSIRDELNAFLLGKKLLQRFDYLQNIKVGDYVFFGAYEQDNNISNGKEKVEWLVLEVRDGKALLISKYALDRKRYNTSKTDVTWETCTLRKWLNNDFLGAAFSADEKAMIPTVTVSADKNPAHSTNPGNATQDQVFLLSITEVNKYFRSNSARQCKPTDRAVANGAHVQNYSGNCFWWLRSPGNYQIFAAYVTKDGDVYGRGFSVNYDNYAVRPALWVDLNSLIF